MATVVAAAAMASAAAALPFSSSSSLSPPRMPTTPFLRYPQHHHLSSLTPRPPLRLPHKRAPPSSSPRSQVSDDADSSAMGSAASPTGDSVVNEVALLAEEPDTPGVGVATKPRKPSPLQRGGTLAGKQAEGKDPSPAALGKSSPRLSSTGKFEDSRWKDGTWNLQQFTKDGKVDWDSVIDAEVLRRKWLEENPEASSNEEPVVFETSVIPWWAWVKRFHLPEAELLNGRAAMVGFFMAYIVDGLTGVGLVDQTSSFLGKLLLFVAVVGILLIRKNEDLANLRQLAKEWNFYDKQWQATWQEGQPPAGSEKQK